MQPSFRALTPSMVSRLWSAPRLGITVFLVSNPSFPTERGNSPAKSLNWEQSWELLLLLEQSACRIQNETVICDKLDDSASVR